MDGRSWQAEVQVVAKSRTKSSACGSVFLELSCFFDDPADVGNLISASSAFSKTSSGRIPAVYGVTQSRTQLSG